MNLYQFYKHFHNKNYNTISQNDRITLGTVRIEEISEPLNKGKIVRYNLLTFVNLPGISCRTNILNPKENGGNYGILKVDSELLALLNQYYQYKDILKSYNRYDDYKIKEERILKELSEVQHKLNLNYNITYKKLHKNWVIVDDKKLK